MNNTITKNIVSDLKDRAENADRTKEKGIVNEKTGSSMILDKNGNINITASETVQYKMKHAEGQSTEMSLQSNTITNRKNLVTDEMIVNKHKFNNNFFEWTDYKEHEGDPTSAIGNLTVNTSLLVKTWEPTLGKWVLIRRPARMPLFSDMMPLPDTPEDMNLVDKNNISVTDISPEIEKMRKEKRNISDLI